MPRAVAEDIGSFVEALDSEVICYEAAVNLIDRQHLESSQESSLGMLARSLAIKLAILESCWPGRAGWLAGWPEC